MSLECRVPPLLLFGLIVAAMLVWGGAAESGSGAGWRLAALLLAVLGTVFGLGGVLRFRRQGTTVTPLHPEQASALVTGGLYRLSRNPMYLGLLCWTMALACYLGGLVGVARSAAAVGLAQSLADSAGGAGAAGPLWRCLCRLLPVGEALVLSRAVSP